MGHPQGHSSYLNEDWSSDGEEEGKPGAPISMMRRSMEHSNNGSDGDGGSKPRSCGSKGK